MAPTHTVPTVRGARRGAGLLLPRGDTPSLPSGRLATAMAPVCALRLNRGQQTAAQPQPNIYTRLYIHLRYFYKYLKVANLANMSFPLHFPHNNNPARWIGLRGSGSSNAPQLAFMPQQD